MSIVHYLSRYERFIDQFVQAMLTVLPGEKLETYTDFCFFRDRLECGVKRPDILILSPDSGEELRRLVEISHLFADIVVLVILPARNRAVFAMAQALNPDLIYVRDDCLTDAPAVFSKIVNNLVQHNYCGNPAGDRNVPQKNGGQPCITSNF